MVVAVTGTPVTVSIVAGTTLTVSITVPADATIMLIGIGQGAGDKTEPTCTVNGDAATNIGRVVNAVATRSSQDVFKFLSPAAGTYDVVGTVAASGNRAFLTAVCFSGTDVVTGHGTVVTDEGDGTPSTTGTITSETGGLCVDFMFVRDGTIASITADTPQAEVLNGVVGSGSSLGGLGGVSTEDGDTSVTMGWSWTNGVNGLNEWCQVGVPLTPASVGGTNTQLQIGDAWKTIDAMQINIADSWKAVAGAQINIGDAWKTIF